MITSLISNDNKAPAIDILTSTLRSGKNVFRARITDDLEVKVAGLEYVHKGNIKTVDVSGKSRRADYPSRSTSSNRAITRAGSIRCKKINILDFGTTKN